MSSTKLSPLEVLQKRKLRLKIKSDTLVETLEDNFDYLQQNFMSLLGDSAVSAVVSKAPPFIQNILGSVNRQEATSTGVVNNLVWLTGKALDVLPFFIKSPKGWIARFVLKQAHNILFWLKKKSAAN
jgi:hypothetical protein